MFTGLVEQIGSVVTLEERDFGTRLVLSCKGWNQPPSQGASISVSGCCLTVVRAELSADETLLSFDMIPETLACTILSNLHKGDTLNLEQSLRADTLIGGHFVQGHVDGVERVLECVTFGKSECRVRLTMCMVDTDVVVPKGSITINGVSLTVATVEEDWFEVVLIPTTIQDTTLGSLQEGDQVNIETDMIARTIARVVRRMQKT
jgi:riboflavin synthase